MLNEIARIGLSEKDAPYKFSFLNKERIVSENFIRDAEPKIIFENDFFAIVYKPSSMPTAPLVENESNTLLSWFLEKCPDAKTVKGRKEIEAGLVNRLDTPTSGLVLIAKTDDAYNYFIEMQDKNLIEKKYIAIVDIDKSKNKMSKEKLMFLKFPKKVKSQFRSFGPKGKMVKPVFSDDKRFIENGKTYITEILSASKINNSDNWILECALQKGYRHQIRSHLASYGLPIKEDALYNPYFVLEDPEKLTKHAYSLQLYAVEIRFNFGKTLK